MERTKESQFSVQEKQLAIYAKALSHPARVAIMEVLAKKDDCICGAIVEELPLAQSTVSQHLAELKKAGLIKGNVSGTSVCYCIDLTGWENAKKAFADFFDKQLGGCC